MKRSSIYLLAGILLIAFGAITLLVAESHKSRSVALAERGVQTAATVKEKSVMKGLGKRSAPTYRVVLVNHKLEDRELTIDLLPDDWEKLQEGKDVDIVYLPENPDIFELGTQDHEKDLLHRTQVTEVLSPIGILLGIALLSIALRSGWRESEF